MQALRWTLMGLWMMVVLVLGPSLAAANTSTDCFFTVGRWGGARTTLPVWLNDSEEHGLHHLGVSHDEAELALRQALSVWNEQSGAALFLQYRGTTSALTVAGALTIAFSDEPDPWGGAAARVLLNRTEARPTQLTDGTIMFYNGYTFDVADSDYQRWEFVRYERLRLVPVLVHELGHAAFQIVHPGGVGFLDNGTFDGRRVQCDDDGRSTVMSPLPYGTPTWPYRSLRAWDKAQAQMRIGRRTHGATLWRNTWSEDDRVWKGIERVANFPLYVATSLTQQRTSGDGVIGYVRQDRPSSPRKVLATDVVQGASVASEQLLDIDTNAAVALASAPGGETLLAYLAYEEPATGLQRICYRRSSNGTGFGSETCAQFPFGNYVTTYRNTVSAAYDPRSRAFLLAAIYDASRDENGEALPRFWVQTLPARGSPVPATITILPSDYLSYNAPSIACSGAKLWGCRIVYQDRSLSGALHWVEANVDPVRGQVVTGARFATELVQFEMPNVVWYPPEDLYRIAFVQDNVTIRSFALAPTATSLSQLPDVFEDGRFLSAPAQSTWACDTTNGWPFSFCQPEHNVFFARWW